MRDLFINYWRKVAETFKGSEYVIAYELINEPWPGDQYLNPLVMIPGLSESINMQDAYDIIALKIR
jgi:aryl-phospho-beta-D-glucosidase BglC (GH1 family)